MGKTTSVKTNYVLGELSPRGFGRLEPTKPIFANGSAILENFIITQFGAIQFRPGTIYGWTTKTPGDRVRIERFQYSTTQQYVIEIGDLYFRFGSVVGGAVGQLVSGGSPVEIATIFPKADIFKLQLANKADVVYIVHPSYHPQKLIRTSTTTFSISDVPFVRGPFLDDNITTTTITPSAATGNGITLTASADIFLAGHVGSLWRINSGATVGAVVKITAVGGATSATADVQAEPDGTAGNIGGTGAYTDWAEGAFSSVRGYPTALTFFEGRLLYGGTEYEGNKWYASVVGAYDNFSKGTALASEAYAYQADQNTGTFIRWMEADADLKLGTSGGTITAKSPSSAGTTPSAPPSIINDTDYACMQTQPEHIGGNLYFLQSNANQIRQLVYDLISNRDKSEDMTLLADHILRDGGGAVEIARQQSPNDRLLLPRNDGQLASFTRNAEQSVQGWCRLIAGSTAMGPGIFESVCVLPQDGTDDFVFVAVQRNINGTVKRFIEYFSPELFLNYWEPVRVDASLSLDNPKTITNINNASPGVVLALGHGFLNGQQVKIDNVVGMTELNHQHYLVSYINADTFSLTQLDGVPIDTTLYGEYLSGGQVRKMVTTISGLDHLEGEVVTVQVDGGLPPAQQTFTVVGGSITLIVPSAVVHVGLPYTGTVKWLPLGDSSAGTGQGRLRSIKRVILRVWESAGGAFGKDAATAIPIIYPSQTPGVNPPTTSILYTGDLDEQSVQFETGFAKDWQPVIVQDKPLPFFLMASILDSEVNE